MLSVLTIFLLTAGTAFSADRFRVLITSIHQPERMTVRSSSSERLQITAGSKRMRIAPERVAGFRAVNGEVDVFANNELMASRTVVVSDADGGRVEFMLDGARPPRRRYRGVLRVTAAAGMLRAEVEMDAATVVACKLGTLFGAGAHLDVLGKAAARLCSTLQLNRHKHAEVDFCDTMHCDLGRDCPAENSPASVAARVACEEIK